MHPLDETKDSLWTISAGSKRLHQLIESGSVAAAWSTGVTGRPLDGGHHEAVAIVRSRSIRWLISAACRLPSATPASSARSERRWSHVARTRCFL